MTKRVELAIDGMSCGHCLKAVREALARVDGVTKADVEIGRARVECEERVAREALVGALADAGYDAT